MGNIIFIVQHLSQPRCIKRINHFINEGYTCRVFGFNKGYYTDNLQNANFEIEEEWNFDKERNKLSKILFYRKHINNVIKKIDEDDIIYAFGFEIGVIVSLLWKYKYIYEEADVSASRFKNKQIRNFLLKLDRRVIKESLFTIFTSEGFPKYIFGSNNPYYKKTIFIHNKLHESFLEYSRPNIINSDDKKIKFGFVGKIRYPNTILRFARVVGENFPNHEFHFFGEAEGDILEQVDWNQYSNIMFHGKFKNPQDLEVIYSKIDVNVVCYDTSSDNVKIAEPNKLYESIYFNKPIVVSKDTFLCDRVKNLNVGFCIDPFSDSSIIKFINLLNTDKIKNIQKSCSKISSKSLINNPTIDMRVIKGKIS